MITQPQYTVIFICDTLPDFVPFVNLQSLKNTHRGMLLLVKLQTPACNFSKSFTLPRVFFTVLKLYKFNSTNSWKASHIILLEELKNL